MNDRWLCKNPNGVAIVMQITFPSTAMVLRVVFSKRDVMTPFLFQSSLRVNAREYIQLQEDTAKPWMNSVAKRRPNVFQQDSAPAHKAQSTHSWLVSNFPFH